MLGCLVTKLIASLAGLHADKTISTWVSALSAWHTIHGYDFIATSSHCVRRALQACTLRETLDSTSAQHHPISAQQMDLLRARLRDNLAFSVSVLAAAHLAFRGCARLGELLLTSANLGGPQGRVMQAGWSVGT